jgi:antirestriction protein ArdC
MKVEEIITARIMEKLEQGTVPWHKPWAGGEYPKNLITKREYRGVNVFILSAMGHGSPFWLSFKQAQELGGCVRKGEKGCPVVFWKWLNKKDENGAITEDKFPMLRYYTVFNVNQIDGIDEKKIPALVQKYNELEKIEQCEAVVMAMPKRPEISHKEQRAYYMPSRDFVNMPKMESFDGSEEYYSTLFHELTHSTGHESRLNRKGVDCPDGSWSSFGSTPYAKEELVAEMGAAFLCGHCQIENKTIDNSAAYIKSWLKKLKDDSKMVIMAAAQAQKASDFILGIKREI